MNDTAPIGLISAISTALGVLGTLVYSYFKGKASFEAQVRKQVEMILRQQNITIKDLKKERAEVEAAKQKVIADREEMSRRIDDLEGERKELKQQISDLRRKIDVISEPSTPD